MLRLSAIAATPMSTAMIAIGTLMKNTDSQDRCSTSTPPRMGPAATETPEAAPQMPIAVLSRCGGKVCRTIASVLGISSAPNTPCRARSPMTPLTEPIRPMPTEVRAKPTTPIRKTRLRPNMSPSLPPKISSEASASR